MKYDDAAKTRYTIKHRRKSLHVGAFNSKVAWYITKPLLKFGVKPNTISTLSLALGIFGALILFFGNIVLFIVSGIIIYISLILDHCDGQIARAKKISSPLGAYYDSIIDRIVEFSIIFSVTANYTYYQGKIPEIISAEMLHINIWYLGFFVMFFIMLKHYLYSISYTSLSTILLERGRNLKSSIASKKNGQHMELSKPVFYTRDVEFLIIIVSLMTFQLTFMMIVVLLGNLIGSIKHIAFYLKTIKHPEDIDKIILNK